MIILFNQESYEEDYLYFKLNSFNSGFNLKEKPINYYFVKNFIIIIVNFYFDFDFDFDLDFIIIN
jgi:hypothetical protein